MRLPEGFVVVGILGMFVFQFALQVAAVVAGLVLWDRFLRRS